MTLKQIESVRRLKLGEIVEIGRVTIRRDRGQYSVTKDKFIKVYKDTDFHVMSEKIDELNTERDTSTDRMSYEIPGTKLIAIKTLTGYELWENGKVIQKGLTDSDVEVFLEHYRKNQEVKKVDQIRSTIVNKHKLSRQKKVLYYLILIISVALLFLTYTLGLKYDGVSIKRNNHDLYMVITELAETKYPEKKFDKYDTVYYTLNYYAHQQNYFMLPIIINETEVQVESAIFLHYQENLLDMNLSADTTYSGFEFNQYFKNDFNRYVTKEETIRRIGLILGYENIQTMDELKSAYLHWDQNDVKSNKAYNWEITNLDGSKPFDYNVSYYNTYLSRNSFVKLFLNDSSRFIHEYNLFESIGWLNWTSIAIFLLYLILAFGIWIFKKDNLTMSKGLVILVAVLFLLIIVPLMMQYFFEGLRKEPTEFLDILENTRFTTTTTMMNFIFDYIMKFSNIILTGILTIALPLKVVRYFVFNAISKLDQNGVIHKTLATGTTLSQDINKVDWRMF